MPQRAKNPLTSSFYIVEDRMSNQHNPFANVATTRRDPVVVNKVLRQTYMLLSMTLLFSGLMAAVSMNMAVPRMASLVCTVGAIGLMWFVLPRFANSSAGIGIVFGITGLLGFGLGPMLQMYASLPNGGQLIATALGGTGVIFLALSGYALVTKRDFSFLASFLMVGLLVVFIAILANIFLQISGLGLALSAMIILLMSGFLLYDTSRIINGSETNYVMATVSMYISMFNIFTSLLHLLGFAGGDD